MELAVVGVPSSAAREAASERQPVAQHPETPPCRRGQRPGPRPAQRRCAGTAEPAGAFPAAAGGAGRRAVAPPAVALGNLAAAGRGPDRGRLFRACTAPRAGPPGGRSPAPTARQPGPGGRNGRLRRPGPGGQGLHHPGAPDSRQPQGQRHDRPAAHPRGDAGEEGGRGGGTGRHRLSGRLRARRGLRGSRPATPAGTGARQPPGRNLRSARPSWPSARRSWNS